jgi:D-3-phosphoglycerate dehydrogenase
MEKFNILLFDDIDVVGKNILEKIANIELAESLEEDYLIKRIKNVDGIIIRANGNITRRIIEHAPKLKVIGRHGVGVEQIDIQAATEHDIQVVNTPDANYESVAEHVIGFMIILSKKMRDADLSVRKSDWRARYNLVGQELFEKTIGIIGFGKIGRRIAEICMTAFNMTALYFDKIKYDAFEQTYSNCRKESLGYILKNSDYISINMPYSPTLYHFIGEKEINLMKKSAYIINTSRGALWDESALYKALKIGTIAGAATDVYEEEPFNKKNKLWDLDNMIFSPHMSAHTKESLIRMSLVAEDVVASLKGKTPKYPVNTIKTTHK